MPDCEKTVQVAYLYVIPCTILMRVYDKARIPTRPTWLIDGASAAMDVFEPLCIRQGDGVKREERLRGAPQPSSQPAPPSQTVTNGPAIPPEHRLWESSNGSAAESFVPGRAFLCHLSKEG